MSCLPLCRTNALSPATFCIQTAWLHVLTVLLIAVPQAALAEGHLELARTLLSVGFERRVNLAAVEPGDIIAIKYTGTLDTGHVMMVDAVPEAIEPRAPVLPETRQWSIAIIDSSPSPHGETDTRYAGKTTGIGRGELRVYSDLDGAPIGYTWGLGRTKYYGMADRPIAIGKPY